MTSTLTSTLLLTILYFLVVRFVDMNEKEPLWAMLMQFALGAVGGALVATAVGQTTLGLHVWLGAASKELVKFLAIGAGVGVLVLYGQRRGWEEFNGTMDGIVYGTCAGLGFGVGEQLVSELSFANVSLPGIAAPVAAGFGKLALSKLSDGVIGAIIGAGFGAASEAKAPISRGALPVLAMLGAIVAEGSYVVLRSGDSLGDLGALRANVALFLPLLGLAVIAAYALASERRAIRTFLDDEVQTGSVSAEDLLLLKSVFARQAAYAKLFFGFQLGRLLSSRALHNTQVQLAFAKSRLADEAEPSRRARTETEVAKIRAALVERRSALGPGGKS
ncbi:MAG: PrsW family glutamic-type intramembrane protease [Sorangiineae bacterium]|nr:PrsW family glutamic-type intramembrane protease [Polyangiaceae bacterium]MEB2321199.1 PrsW family glutamic-type intramembrane protease [Sorangiineae bacterium]